MRFEDRGSGAQRVKPTLIYKQKPALMLASSLASFPFQLQFISSSISIKHLVSSHYGAQFCTGCLFLKEMKGKSMSLVHVENGWVGGWAGRRTQTVLWDSQRRLDLGSQFIALSLGDKFPNLSKPIHPSCCWGIKWNDMVKSLKCCYFTPLFDFWIISDLDFLSIKLGKSPSILDGDKSLRYL